ncbi:hypothetical protein [Bartonella capreoli]
MALSSVKIKGFHYKFKNSQVIIVPHSKDGFPIGTGRSIIAQQASW